MSDRGLDISYASESEAVELHLFLVLMGKPIALAPIDAEDSMEGVLEVIRDGAAILARINGEIVGALGLIPATWYYNRKVDFLTDRFFFVFPQLHHLGIGARLLAEARALAEKSGIVLVINGHMKRRNGVVFTHPKVFQPKG